jgi:transcriptional regulator with XRE-family HTH domain
MSMKKNKKISEGFGENVRFYRMSAGLTQQELADETLLHVNFIGRIERGSVNPSLISIIYISNALKISPMDLIRGIS